MRLAGHVASMRKKKNECQDFIKKFRARDNLENLELNRIKYILLWIGNNILGHGLDTPGSGIRRITSSFK